MVQRNSASFYIKHVSELKQQMLSWANRFGICCFMDSHNYNDKYHKYDCLVAAGSQKIFSPQSDFFSLLDIFYNENNDWIFGHLNYDLKNKIEQLQSIQVNKIAFVDIFFFIPVTVLCLKEHELTIHCIEREPYSIFNEIKAETVLHKKISSKKNILFTSAVSKKEYIETVEKLQQHILRGDCYEINFCQEFFAENISIEPVVIYNHLLEISPTPFSCFYKLKDKYLLCASPERFLSKAGSTISSQPIKGTAARNADLILDDKERENLYYNKKERSENVMIVDIVRNDLSKICKEGTVEAAELFGIYSFPQMHQMISTIKGELKQDISFSEVIKATFPMGSMTGAPKLRAMQLIDQYEKTKRGLFSGSVGYISPEKDFDFNVVIRSIFYNAANKYLNYLVGSAITFYSDAEKEYDECLLKAKAINEIL